MKKVKCNYCGTEFFTREWQFKKYKRHFCSSNCQKKYNKIHPLNKTLVPIECKFCGKLFQPKTKNNIYCCHECSTNDKKKKPLILKKENYAIIKVKYKDKFFEVFIDLEDVEKCAKYRWTLLCNNKGFLYFRNREIGLLHRYIVDCPDGMVVDHINHNTLDNRRQNLRICTFKDNCKNRNLLNESSITGHTYIMKDKRSNNYIVEVRGKYIGQYKNLEAALEVRDKYLGENKL